MQSAREKRFVTQRPTGTEREVKTLNEWMIAREAGKENYFEKTDSTINQERHCWP